MSRNADEGSALYEQLFQQGVNVNLIFLKEPHINTDVYKQAIERREVDDLHQRAKEGIETARRHNEQIGQRPGGKLNVKKAVSAKECIRKLAGISRNTFYKRILCRYFHFTSWRFVFELSIFDRINSICKLICVAHKVQISPPSRP